MDRKFNTGHDILSRLVKNMLIDFMHKEKGLFVGKLQKGVTDFLDDCFNAIEFCEEDMSAEVITCANSDWLEVKQILHFWRQSNFDKKWISKGYWKLGIPSEQL